MRSGIAIGMMVVALSVAGCQDTMAPAFTEDASPAFAAVQTGPDNKCYGQIIAGIASTWPYAHEDHASFAPPPGAIALWVRTFGPSVGISSVRELQLLFCTT
jgi:hypothetical protein